MEADTSRHTHRWTTPTGILFDLVPAGTHLGGSGSPLDQVAVDTAVAIALHTSNGAAMVIRHADAPTFLALKWAAFEDRGGGDLLGSHDVEDILASEDTLGEVLQAAESSRMLGTIDTRSWHRRGANGQSDSAACRPTLVD